MFRQHRTQRHVDRTARLVRREDLALQVVDGSDRAIPADDERVGVVAGHSVLELVGDDSQIRHPGILDPECEGRVGQCRAIELASRERGHLSRGAGEMSELGNVGLTGMGREIRLDEHQGYKVRRRHHPTYAEMIELPCLCLPDPKKRQRQRCSNEGGRRALPHALAPTFRGALYTSRS